MKRIAVAVILTALFACRSDQVLPPRPSADIFDAGHGSGNPFFAFLQPIVSQPVLNGAFDPTLSPTVRIDLLSGLCTGTPITYTVQTGPATDASETIRVSSNHYIVNLHTDKVPVNSGCTYRIHVLVGSTDLGYADIALLLTMKEARNMVTNETMALVDGRTLPISFWIAVGALGDVGQGVADPNNTVTITTRLGNAGVVVPAGAVSTPTTIIIQSVDDRPCIPTQLGRSFTGSPGATENSCYRFTTNPPLPGGMFNIPVVIGICVDLESVSAAQRPKIQIFRFDAQPATVAPLPNVAAPFLTGCGGTTIGSSKPNLFERVAQWFGGLVGPRPAFAGNRHMVFHIGAGGSSCCMSLFTWGLVTDMLKNGGDLQVGNPASPVGTPPSVIFKDSTGATVDSVPVTFSIGTGGGSVTGASTKSGRGGISGVAQVGSWTLGSAGPNTLIVTGPPGDSSVTPMSVTFTAAAGAGWSVTGSLAAAREFHAAVPLADGAMILGGHGTGTTTLSSVEAYDTVPNNFRTLASMLSPREQFAAVVLATGNEAVLAIGGLIRGTNTTLASAERYDWGTNSWSFTGSMTTGRWGHTATRLQDGRVLVTGGFGSEGGVLSSAEVYDPGTNAFTIVGNMAFAREGHTATLLANGKVLIAGGFNGVSIGPAELFDPVTNTFAVTGTMALARHGHTATLLNDGTVLVTGGVNIVTGQPAALRTPTAELYDPVAGTFALTGSMASVRVQHAAVLLPDGTVLVTGGEDASATPVATAELFNPGTGAFTSAGTMANPRARHTVTLLPGGFPRALAVGGGSPTVLQSAEVYKP